jgi:hypothetical protein
MTVHVGSHFGSHKRCRGTRILPIEQKIELTGAIRALWFPATKLMKIANALDLGVFF